MHRIRAGIIIIKGILLIRESKNQRYLDTKLCQILRFSASSLKLDAPWLNDYLFKKKLLSTKKPVSVPAHVLLIHISFQRLLYSVIFFVTVRRTCPAVY